MLSTSTNSVLFAVSKEEHNKKRIQTLCERIRQIKSCAEQNITIPSDNLKKWEKKAEDMLLVPCSSEVIESVEREVEQFRSTHRDKLLRLSPSDLNAMLGFLPENYNLANEKLTKCPLQNSIMLQSKTYWRKNQKNGKNFYTFTVSKDEAKAEIKQNLPHIGDVIQQFKSEVSDEKAILLLPMLQCRKILDDYLNLSFVTTLTGWDLEKSHMVLVEVNLEKKTIEVHDSNVRWSIYPDALIKVAEKLKFDYLPSKHYHDYKVQKDNVLCGYYANKYHDQIIETGDSTGLGKIVLDECHYTTKLEYIRALWPKWGECIALENEPKWVEEIVTIESPKNFI